jgi:hypothetical protein
MCEALENDIQRLRLERPFQPNIRTFRSDADGSDADGSDADGSDARDAHGARDGQNKRVIEERREDQELSWLFKASLRAFLVTVTAALCYAVEDFSAMSALSGGFGNNMVGFILPPLFITSMKRQSNWWEENGVGWWGKWFEISVNCLISLGGVALLVSSVKSFLNNL